MKKRGKKAQITIFIILAVLIVAGVVLFFIFKNGIEKKGDNSPEIAPIKNFAEECLENVLENGIEFNSLQGGYYSVPNLSMQFYEYHVPYYFYEGKKYFPTREIIKHELSEYFLKNINQCSDFSNLNLTNYNISFKGQPSIKKIVIEEDQSYLEIKYLLIISKQDSAKIIDSFKINSMTNLASHYLIIEKIVNEQNKNTSYMPMGFISNLAYEENFTFDIISLDNGAFIYAIFFDKDNIKKGRFFFAVKYEEQNNENNQ